MNMRAEPNIRARYLSLALDARKVIDALVEYVKKSDTPQMEPLVRRVLESFDAASNRERLFSSVGRRSLFGDYERMQTLNEVKRDFSFPELQRQLKELLSNDVALEERRHSAEQALEFFCALEGKALERYTEAMDM